MTIDMSTWPDLLRLEQVDWHRYRGAPANEGKRRNVVFGGQIVAQAIVAAHLDRSVDQSDEKVVKSVHAVFARAGDYGLPIEFEVERMHDGRTLGSDTVTFAQNGRIVSRLLILWSRDEPDLIRHTEHVAQPQVAGPDDPSGRPDLRVFPGAIALVVEGVDTWSADHPEREARQNVWTRCGYPVDDPVVAQAILSWATDGYLIGTAMLPHPGLGEEQAHRTISTGVVSHTINFHDRFDPSEWLLLANESIWAGRGRTHGRANVWTRDGRLVATYTQDNLVRSFGAQSDSIDYLRVL